MLQQKAWTERFVNNGSHFLKILESEKSTVKIPVKFVS